MEKSTDSSVWSPSELLSPRVKALRQEYFSFNEREYFRNEVRPYTTGTRWDVVYSPHNWGVVPETFIFFASYADSLRAAAETVALPEDFYTHSLALRKAMFFDKVVTDYLPVKILDGELIVGSYFNTALSRCFTPKEAKQWQTLETEWEQELKLLDSVGVGNTGAIPGHLIPNYKKVIEMGFQGIEEEIQRALDEENDPDEREYLQALRLSAQAPGKLARRYSQLAREMAVQESDPLRRQELITIAEHCEQVPEEKPRGFYQGLQALCFTHMLVMAAESYPGAVLSYGRIDQYLYPLKT
ncbi:MAG: pyruvate formate lyase family protein [Desulfitobacteriaceae bacterium]